MLGDEGRFDFEALERAWGGEEDLPALGAWPTPASSPD
jgi:hypothetical protein